MKKLLNTLYVLTPDSYLFCRNETVGIKVGDAEKVSVPAVGIEAIVCFGKTTVSTPLIGFCAERGISLVFLSEHGQFLARVEGLSAEMFFCESASMKVWANRRSSPPLCATC